MGEYQADLQDLNYQELGKILLKLQLYFIDLHHKYGDKFL